jgi:peptidyl-prolyl cis-trans isomerase C
MFNDVKKRIIYAASAVVLLSSQPAFAAEEAKEATLVSPDAVVARVNGDEIKYSDLEMMKAGNPQLSMIPMSILYNKMLKHVVESKMIVDAAKKEKIQDSKEYKDAMKFVGEGVLKRLYLQKRVGDEISDEQLVTLYEKYKKENPATEEIHARHILVKTEEEAKQIIEDLKTKKAKFEDIAKEKSIGPTKTKGGDLGWFSKDRMVKEFAEAAFALKKGHITTEPVKTQFGWHVIKLEDRREGVQPPLEEVRPVLESKYAEEKIQADLDKLVKTSKVEVFDTEGKPLKFEDLDKQ